MMLYRFIILDVSLGSENGYDACRQIRQETQEARFVRIRVEDEGIGIPSQMQGAWFEILLPVLEGEKPYLS